jgi:hypothetical protein
MNTKLISRIKGANVDLAFLFGGGDADQCSLGGTGSLFGLECLSQMVVVILIVWDDSKLKFWLLRYKNHQISL